MEKNHELQARRDALRLLLELPGWRVIVEHVEAEKADALHSLVKQMESEPEKLTGRLAFKIAMRYRAYEDLLDWVASQVKQ